MPTKLPTKAEVAKLIASRGQEYFDYWAYIRQQYRRRRKEYDYRRLKALSGWTHRKLCNALLFLQEKNVVVGDPVYMQCIVTHLKKDYRPYFHFIQSEMLEPDRFEIPVRVPPITQAVDIAVINACVTVELCIDLMFDLSVVTEYETEALAWVIDVAMEAAVISAATLSLKLPEVRAEAAADKAGKGRRRGGSSRRNYENIIETTAQNLLLGPGRNWYIWGPTSARPGKVNSKALSEAVSTELTKLGITVSARSINVYHFGKKKMIERLQSFVEDNHLYP